MVGWLYLTVTQNQGADSLRHSQQAPGQLAQSGCHALRVLSGHHSKPAQFCDSALRRHSSMMQPPSPVGRETSILDALDALKLPIEGKLARAHLQRDKAFHI